MKKKLSFALLSGLVLPCATLACTTTYDALEARFAREESCSGSVHVENSGNRYTAEGCNKRVVYVCKSFASMSQTECVRNDLPNPATTRVGEGPRFPERIEDTSPNDRAR